MKRIISVVLTAVILVGILGFVPGGMLTAYADTSGDYTYTVSDGTATITKCDSASGAIAIPSTLGGYSVTSIGDSAFSTCISLTNVTIPNSVTSIGDSAFFASISLTSITIPSSVTSIGDSAFSGCSKLIAINVDANNPNYSSSGCVLFNKAKTLLMIAPGIVGTYVIPSSVTSIGDSAFFNCRSLTNITIPNSVTSIGDSAFFDCRSLTNITIPNSVTSIGGAAFLNCSNLTSITIPSSVTSIGYKAFYGCGISFTILGVKGSYAETYANNKDIVFTAKADPSLISVLLDDVKLAFDQQPIIENDRTLVPLRAIFEAMGATIAWDDGTQTVTAVKGEITIVLQVGKKSATKNGKQILLDVPAMVINDRTLVPVRFIAESMGAKVDWDDANSTVNITTE